MSIILGSFGVRFDHRGRQPGDNTFVIRAVEANPIADTTDEVDHSDAGDAALLAASERRTAAFQHSRLGTSPSFRSDLNTDEDV